MPANKHLALASAALFALAATRGYAAKPATANVHEALKTPPTEAGALPWPANAYAVLGWIFGESDDKCSDEPDRPECRIPDPTGPCSPWPKCAGDTDMD